VRIGEAGHALEPGDLVLLEQELDPPGELLDRVEPLAVHRAEVELRGYLDAELGHCAVRAASKYSDACSIAFDGMQPTLRQVPPSVSRLSAARGLQPELRARMAAT
jgi:hypothetical protein